MSDTHETGLPVQLKESEEAEKAQEVIQDEIISEVQPITEGEGLFENGDIKIEMPEVVIQKIEIPAGTKKDDDKLTKESVIDKLKLIVQKAPEEVKDEVDLLKRTFYKLRKVEIEEQKKQFVENGGEEKDFVSGDDKLETELKKLLNVFKEKRTQFLEHQEKVKEENLKRKEQLIEEIKNLTESSGDINKAYNEFKKIQQEWNEITLIPQIKVNEVWHGYQMQVEKFYDLVKINNEFRDYDFKKNMEAKTALCEAAEKLDKEPDVISAFHRLQNLHQQWREIGPVAREQREEIWNRFKAASTVINKRHQEHFEKLREEENKNLKEKTALCEAVEAVDTSLLNTFKDWNEKTQVVLDCQAKWKTIGFAPKKVNEKIFERFRTVCDKFFHEKGEFYKNVKSDLSANYEKKKELCEKAKALKDSTDWKSTTDALIALQKEWKAIGAVPKKYSEALWLRFIGACDYFFEQKNKHTSSEKSHENENLNRKKEIIEKIRQLDPATDSETTLQSLRTLAKEFSEVGHVPFKEKDKIYKEYHAELDRQFDRLNVDRNTRKLSSFKDSLKDISDSNKNRLFRERDKLYKMYEILKNEIQTYENNIGFLSASSKNAGTLLKEMERKIEKLKEELELIVGKIEAIDEKMKG
ncbi:MAG: DUF349 domain-containing protein [Candidatus Azobacteroides sp.]|nr:DUF349 domain-containing protein [Candidatus Azobacteroides sp.]